MTGTNHALTGVALAGVITQPFVLLPVAFVSHFVLDALPHFGLKEDERRTKLFQAMIVVDAVLLISLLAYAIWQGQLLWIIAGLVAMSPDFVWIYRFVVDEKFGKLPWKPVKHPINRFHVWIQQHEFKNGIYIEAAFTVAMGLVVLGL